MNFNSTTSILFHRFGSPTPTHTHTLSKSLPVEAGIMPFEILKAAESAIFLRQVLQINSKKWQLEEVIPTNDWIGTDWSSKYDVIIIAL